jgi:hypothetical protein
MSLIEQIKTRNYTDLINEGARVSLVGSVASGTDTIICPMPADRFMIITGYNLSTDSLTPILASIGLKHGSDPTIEFCRAYVGGGAMLSRDLSFGNWIYGNLGYNIVISAAGNIIYTIDGRLCAGLVPLGYIQQIGSKEHANPYFGPPSGKDRGQSEL